MVNATSMSPKPVNRHWRFNDDETHVSLAIQRCASYLRERQTGRRDRAPTDEQRVRTASMYYRAPRFRALYRAWLHQGDGVVWAAASAVLKDKVERREGRFEFTPLSRQYLHLSSLVGVA